NALRVGELASEVLEIALQACQPGVERMRKAPLLFVDYLRHAFGRFLELRISVFHQIADSENHLEHERLLCTEQAAMANAAAQDLAQHVAAAFVGGQHAVGNKE